MVGQQFRVEPSPGLDPYLQCELRAGDRTIGARVEDRLAQARFLFFQRPDPLTQFAQRIRKAPDIAFTIHASRLPQQA